MMAAIALDHLSKSIQDDVGLAYIFCNYKSQADQGIYDLLSALLKQLVQSRPNIAIPVTNLYEHHSKRKIRPSLNDIFECLLAVCAAYAKVYVVVDALDECEEQNGTRSGLIERLRQLHTSATVQLLFTSRFIPVIEEKFKPEPMLEIRASKEDVKRFIADQIPRLPACIKRDDELISEVQIKIVEAVGSM